MVVLNPCTPSICHIDIVLLYSFWRITVDDIAAGAGYVSTEKNEKINYYVMYISRRDAYVHNSMGLGRTICV